MRIRTKSAFSFKPHRVLSHWTLKGSGLAIGLSLDALQTDGVMTWVLMTCDPKSSGVMISTVLGVRGLDLRFFQLHSP